MVSGYDLEELDLKRDILAEIMEKHGMIVIDPEMFGPELNELRTTDPAKMPLGIKGNIVGAHKGAFQWTACAIKLEHIPEIAKEYEQLVLKYWKTSDPSVSVEHAMTGTDIQGPLPFGRCGSCEFDWWWDQGEYFTLLKKTKKAFDPANLMHPDVLPLTDDYV